jgi:hypothetical protein
MGRQKDRQWSPQPEDLTEWTVEDLVARANRCRAKEQAVKPNKARRGWKKAAEEAEAELARRAQGEDV